MSSAALLSQGLQLLHATSHKAIPLFQKRWL